MRRRCTIPWVAVNNYNPNLTLTRTLTIPLILSPSPTLSITPVLRTIQHGKMAHPLGRTSEPIFSRTRGVHTTKMVAFRSDVVEKFFHGRVRRSASLFALSPRCRENQLRTFDREEDVLSNLRVVFGKS